MYPEFGSVVVGLFLADPALDADLAVDGQRFREAVVDVLAQRVQRNAALALPLAAGDVGATKAARALDTNALGAQRQTLFMGETLRGLLLNVYAFSIFGAVAFFAGWVALVGAVAMIVLAVYGFTHAHKLHKAELLEARAIESIPVS